MSAADDVLPVPDGEMRLRLATHINPHLSILIERDVDLPAGIRYRVADMGGAPHWRVTATLDYLRVLRDLARLDRREDALAPAEGEAILFQSDDAPGEAAGVSWEARRSWPAMRLVPDIYYYEAGGYGDYGGGLPPWRERPSRFVWRGTTTGHVRMSADDLDALPRYRLCRIANAFGRTDCGFAEAVQGRTPEDDARMQARLIAEGLVRPFVPLDRLTADARYLFDIDGNANSWNFIARLKLGCCLLKVESDWMQWFSARLKPWHHYVPVAPDLSDLAERMAWCLEHPADAERIAAAGKRFGDEMSYEAELAAAAAVAFPPIS